MSRLFWWNAEMSPLIFVGDLSPVGAVIGSGETPTAGIRLGSNGVLEVLANREEPPYDPIYTAIPNQWQRQAGLFPGSEYEVQVTVSGSGGTFTGTTGSWLGLGTAREWVLTRTEGSPGSVSRTLTLTIRRVADSQVVATATIVLTAERLI